MPDAYVHRMPFGAEVLPGGAVRFRLWAPSQNGVALVLEDEQRVIDIPASSIVIQNLPEAPQGMNITHVDVVVRVRKGA